MTAIAGIWHFDDRPTRERCAMMLSTLSIFGRHHRTQTDLDVISLGRCLMRTVPEDQFDRQPLASRNSPFHIVADGRVDNRAELSKALSLSETDLSVMADSDLIFRAYERWQDDCCDHLVGDYAFAVWNDRKQDLKLFRDPLGKRPLFFYRCDQFVAFASMPQGLQALPDIPRGPDLALFSSLLNEMSPCGDRSFHKDIRKVLPAHYAVITPQSAHQYRHWNPQYRPERSQSHADYVAMVRETLDKAVAAQIRGASHVATELSAGLDSAAVTTSAALHLREKGTVDAYTSVPRDGYDGSGSTRLVDEGPNAAMTSGVYPNINHHCVRATTPSLLNSLHETTQYDAQPIYNLCNKVWINAISHQAVKDGHSVLLSGRLGNFTFSYWNDYYLSDYLKRGRLWAYYKALATIKRADGHLKFRTAALRSIYRLLPLPILAPLHEYKFKSRALHGQRRQETHKALKDMKSDDWSRRLKYFEAHDVHSFDKSRLAQFGLDVRDPTGDRRLIELCLNIPPHMFCHGGIIRSIAMGVLKDRVPEPVLSAPAHGLQAADWHETFLKDQDALKAQLDIISDVEPLNQMIPVKRLKASMESLPKEGWNTEDNVAKYRLSVLRAVSYGDYFRRLSGSNR